MSRYRVTNQQVPCDDCGELVTFIVREPVCLEQTTDEHNAKGYIALTLTTLATAWADAPFRCHDCDERIRQSHPSLRTFLHRFH
jgi:hypothetical protein